MAFIERTTRAVRRFNINDAEELEQYNSLIRDPKVKVIRDQVLTQSESHFEEGFSTTTTNHIVLVEVEICSL
jgi:hypothetical protein